VGCGLAFTPEDTATEQLAKIEHGLGTLASAESIALLADFQPRRVLRRSVAELRRVASTTSPPRERALEGH